MAVAKRVFEAANADLAAALRKGGLEPGQLLGGIFNAEVAVRCGSKEAAVALVAARPC